jgi:hypothetical protein
MPFDLFVSRASSFGAVDKPGWFRGQRAIQPEEFRGAMKGILTSRRPNGDIWVKHPEDGSPWLAARLTEMGSIVLSCSYSNHRYLRNFADAMKLGVQIAGALSASLYEEVRGERVTRENLDALLDPNGSYVGLQAGAFRSAVTKLNSDPGGPLEYPLGVVDMIGEYFVCHHEIPSSAPETVVDLLAPLSLTTIPGSIEPSHLLLFSLTGAAVCKVLRRPDQKLQVWPFHGHAPFSECATAVLEVIERVKASYPGATTFNQHPLTEELLQELKRRATGLGVELYLWYDKFRTAN